MSELWTNRNALSDFIRGGLETHCASPSVSEVFIAVAFFTEAEIVEKIISNDCNVKMVVRLGYPTSPLALQKLINNTSIQIRYYSDSSFHPKLYIFGNDVVLTGSANLTSSAINSNQEIMVSIKPEDPRFDELTSLFYAYWNEAQELNQDDLAAYSSIFNKHSRAMKEVEEIDRELQNKIGKHVFSNINRVEPKKSTENIFIDSYRKKYQEWVAAFKQIKGIYDTVGKRKNDAVDVPIRIEIDAFVSFVREKYAAKEKWKEPPAIWNDARKAELLSHIHEWIEVDWPYYDEICNVNYPLIAKIFESRDTINASEYDEIIDALVVLHSFRDRQRFFPGGLTTLCKTFKDENELSKVKNSLSYLLFGDDKVISRMADLIYNDSYKLRHFGRSNVQELIGWVNNDGLPIVNSRTTKIFRFYGFDIIQI